jgi:hypothetical protein
MLWIRVKKAINTKIKVENEVNIKDKAIKNK